MFKRSTKLTALLVAAASVASTVPAMAATKLATKDGTIEKGVAYKDNKYLYQGYRTDSDDNGLYISTSGKDDKKLDDANEIIEKFNDKYVAAKDGSDDYVVDLESGKITDEDTIDDLEDTALTKLQNKLKTADDRFKNGTADSDGKISFTKIEEETMDDARASFDSATNAFLKVTENKLEDNYYVYKVSGAQNPENAYASGVSTDVFGYTNDSGKYIDCSYDLNLYAYATSGAASDGKMYKVEDVDSAVDNGNKDANGDKEKISVESVRFVKYIGQDDKYIYSVIAVKLNHSYSVYTGSEIGNDKEHFYVQKVSKEQGDKKNDAYLPKTTECFEIATETDGDIAIGNGDVQTAYQALALIGDGSNLAGDFKNLKANQYKYAIVDGAIYVYWESSTDKIKITKIKLATSEKLDRFNATVKDKDANKLSSHVALKAGDQDHKMVDNEGNKGEYGNPWTVDINGTLWFIKEGSIFKCVKMGDWEEVYTCDRSLDRLDVYDENNLIAWDADGDVYTTIDEGTEEAKKEAEEIVGKEENTTTEPAVTTKTGWDQLADGTWNLYDATGAKVTGWANVGGVWYYMDPVTAVMKTGWVLDRGTWYYCNASGAMQTGWVLDRGTWYYCNASGAMQTGWINDNGTWYYCNASGAMLANTTIDGYVLGANGAWIR